jgi:hypothetical protein
VPGLGVAGAVNGIICYHGRRSRVDRTNPSTADRMGTEKMTLCGR